MHFKSEYFTVKLKFTRCVNFIFIVVFVPKKWNLTTFVLPLWSNFYLLIFLGVSHRILWKDENAVYRLQISAIVPEIFKFVKCLKYANEMSDDVIYSTQYYIKYINRAILINLQWRPLKFGRLIVLQKTPYCYKTFCSHGNSLFFSPHPLNFNMLVIFSSKTSNKATNSS